MTALEKRLEEIERRCERATKGPWANESDDEFDNIPYIGISAGEAGTDSWKWISHVQPTWQEQTDKLTLTEEDWANASFIAAAREDVPFLLSELRKHLKVSEAATGALKPFAEVIDALGRTRELDRDARLEPLPTIHFHGPGTSGGCTLRANYFYAAKSALALIEQEPEE